jgi:hypothetical protein
MKIKKYRLQRRDQPLIELQPPNAGAQPLPEAEATQERTL